MARPRYALMFLAAGYVQACSVDGRAAPSANASAAGKAEAAASTAGQLAAIKLPADLQAVLAERERIAGAMEQAEIHTDDASFIQTGNGREHWYRGGGGRLPNAREFSGRFFKGFRFIPAGYGVNGSVAYIFGTARGPTASQDSLNFTFGLKKDSSGAWRIAVEKLMTKNPPVPTATGGAASAAAAAAPATELSPRERIVPLVGHHQHLLSPMWRRIGVRPSLPLVAPLPADLQRVLLQRQAATDADLFTEDVSFVTFGKPGAAWAHGRAAALANAQSQRRDMRLIANDFGMDGSVGFISGSAQYADSIEDDVNFVLGLRKGRDGVWRIAADDVMRKPPPTYAGPILAADLIKNMDEAGMKRAVVLSTGYTYGSAQFPPREKEFELVRQENDWTAEQVGQFPGRLAVFCGVNPLKDYAVQEVERCKKDGRFKGMKLQFANSGVDLEKPEHVEAIKRFFSAANRHRMAIAAHLWTLDPKYGAVDSQIFFDQVLPVAPDIVIQIAHMAGQGSYTHDDAMEVFAKAAAAGDKRMKNVYFDLTTVVSENTSQNSLELLTKRMRQIGMGKMVFGSDMHPNPPLRQAWATFRRRIPLTDEEVRTIANNVAPYLR